MLAYNSSSHADASGVIVILFLLVVFGGIGIFNYVSNYLEEKRRYKKDAEYQLSRYNSEHDIVLSAKIRIGQLQDAENRQKAEYDTVKDFIDLNLGDWKKYGAMLPTLREWGDRIRSEHDERLVSLLKNKRPPAIRASEEVKAALAKSRESKKEADRLAAQLAIYESQAPWLADFTDCTVEEIIEGIKEESELRELYTTGADPVSLFVPKTEWATLSPSERNQSALDRYWSGSRRRSAWTAGIQYERFVGYQYEASGFEVEYHGAKLGKNDLGIDLVCTKGAKTLIVQCKRLSKVKGIPVRENVIAQVFGASRFYTMENGITSKATPVLVTTYECSETARKFAKHLGVELKEDLQFSPYPCIKCNISQSNGGKIYHLPFDQQYDSTHINITAGEFYAMTIAEAEAAGFRRAFRWNGNG